MALADYFSKDLLALNQLIRADHELFEKRLNAAHIRIDFGENTTKTEEGLYGLELLVRLLARLYPNLTFKGDDKLIIRRMQELAQKINPRINVQESDIQPTIIVQAGFLNPSKEDSEATKLYFGSDNWLAYCSNKFPKRFGDTKNPIGSAIAACIIASNVFRIVFSQELGGSTPDTDCCLSGFSLDNEEKDNPPLENILLDDVVLAGIGAIGNGVVWILGRIPEIGGRISLIDHEQVAKTNLQRYILTEASHEKRYKVRLAEDFLKVNAPTLKCCVFAGKWEEYIGQRPEKIKSVGVGIDNAEGRIHIQSSLPEKIFNAFTENQIIGISRHTSFEEEACLACSYIPAEGHIQLHYHEEIAVNFQIPEHADLIKIYLNTRTPVGQIPPQFPPNNQPLLELIQQRLGIKTKELEAYKDRTADVLYSELICGGVILQWVELTKEIKQLDAPLAFQSALAGVLLAAEIVKNASIGPSLPQRTDIYPLAPIHPEHNPFHRGLEKDVTGRCICRDDDFKNGYNDKWRKTIC